MSGILARARGVPSWQVALGLALLTLGFLVAAQVRSEPPRVRYTTQERPPLVETARQLQQQQDQLKARIVQLRGQIGSLEQGSQGNAAAVKTLNDQLQQARIAAGLVALKGPGLVLQFQDSTATVPAGGNQADYLVSARDLRTAMDELWLAGAEAIAINGERIVASTAIVDIGGSILVNSAYQAGPYQVAAIGPADLYDRLKVRVGWIDFLRARVEPFNLRVGLAEPPEVDVPAYAGAVNLRYARPDESPAPSPSASAR
ncbi:MAG TPA: DUF881 domain-containing protein [Candidatus Limnocylindrales bacterium]